MLFNSAIFIAGFLPICLIGFYALGKFARAQTAFAWLTVMSLVFYGWWNIMFVPLLLGSILFNFLVGRGLARTRSRPLLVFSIAANILLLGFFKYTDFIGMSVSQLLALHWQPPQILLPLAISFFTFQQIAFLADAYDGVANEPRLLHYTLFITFFPHLIAGPITHHREMLPQFAERRITKLRLEPLSLGVTIFAIGLFKKVMIADQISVYATPVFTAAAHGAAPSLVESWGASLAYAMQMYFDFSGYSDMAIGLGLMFDISLPINFNSPYKAASIIEYWQRWHMTLTRFLTAYIYNPIVLSLTRRRVATRKPILRPGQVRFPAFMVLLAFPTIFTMFIAGIWHGAGWQFMVFGVLHGIFLTINHGWRTAKARWPVLQGTGIVRHAASVCLTFFCAMLALVFFRAADLETGFRVASGLFGGNGIVLPETIGRIAAFRPIIATLGLKTAHFSLFWRFYVYWLPILFWIVWFMPNVMEWMRHYQTALGAKFSNAWYHESKLSRTLFATWRPTAACGCVVGTIAVLALLRTFSNAPTEFLYFHF